MPKKRAGNSLLKKAASALLVLLFSIGCSVVLPQEAASQLSTNPKKYPPGTKFTPNGIPYDEKGMKAEYGSDWKRILDANDRKLADFYGAQKNRLRDATNVVFTETSDLNALINSFPFLREDIQQVKKLQTRPGETPLGIAESRIDKAGIKILLVNMRGPLYCGSHGCGFDVYVNEGTGYKKALSIIAFDPVRLSSADGHVSLFFGLPEKNGRTPPEWMLKDHAFAVKEPPEVE